MRQEAGQAVTMIFVEERVLDRLPGDGACESINRKVCPRKTAESMQRKQAWNE